MVAPPDSGQTLDAGADIEVPAPDAAQDVAVRPDATPDVSPDVSRDAAQDAPFEEAPVDVVVDAAADAADAPSDARVDAPADAEPPPRFVDVDVGYSHACAVDREGFVYCWGENGLRQLGVPSAERLLRPARVAGVDQVRRVALGDGFTCALRADGTVRCWGRASMLGLPRATADVSSPTALPTLTGVTAIGASRINACALRAGGEVLCWGINDNAQAYDSGFVGTPTLVTGLTPVAEVAVGASHRCVRLVAGGVRCWGYGQAGRLGTGNDRDRTAPTPVVGIDEGASVTLIAAGLSSGCAAVDGRVRCWGSAEIARASVSTSTPAPPVEGVGRARVLSIDAAACAIDETSALRCWGSNNSGMLGTGSTGPAATLVSPVGLGTASWVATGGTTACAIRDGAVYCWGSNGDGAVGDGTTTPRYAPVRVLPL